jgi:hypothetical protein
MCGLAWPCPDAVLQKVRRRYAQSDINIGAWNVQQTAAYPQVGRAGRLTRAQQHWANGGRS